MPDEDLSINILSAFTRAALNTRASAKSAFLLRSCEEIDFRKSAFHKKFRIPWPLVGENRAGGLSDYATIGQIQPELRTLAAVADVLRFDSSFFVLSFSR